MGGGVSRLKPEEQLPRRLRPIFRRKIEEARRRRIAAARCRDSIVSTTELLDSASTVDSDEVVPHLPPSPEEEEEMSPEGAAKEQEEKEGRRGGSTSEELPGSPSFRVYCIDAAVNRGGDTSDDDSVKFVGLQKEDKLQEIVEKTQEKDDGVSSKDMESKTAKKEGRRLRVLMKAHIAMHHWLDCYSKRPATLPRHDGPRF